MIKNLPAVLDTQFYPWVGKSPWRKGWLATPVTLLGRFHGQRSPAGYSPWGHKEPDTTERPALSVSLLIDTIILTEIHTLFGASLVAQQERICLPMRVSLILLSSIPGSERSLGEGMATHSSILA